MEIKEKNSLNCNRKSVINNKNNQISNISGLFINNGFLTNNLVYLGVKL